MLNFDILHLIGKTIDTSNNPHAGIIGIASLGGFALIFGLALYLIARQKKVMAQFAAKNGWQNINNDDNNLSNYVPKYIKNNVQSVGHKYQMAYRAHISNQEIVFFRYEDTINAFNGINNRLITTTDNRSDLQVISYAIAAFEVQQNFGQLLILRHSRLSNFGLHPDLEKFTLEGDFSEHFDVYAPHGSAAETLSVLTPDMMAFLIDHGQHSNINIQIDGYSVIIEGDAQLISPKKIFDLLNYATALKQKLAAKPLVNQQT